MMMLYHHNTFRDVLQIFIIVSSSKKSNFTPKESNEEDKM